MERFSLAYTVTLGVRTPDYEVYRAFWWDKHYEGGQLSRDSTVIELFQPQKLGKDWRIGYDWQSDNLGEASRPLDINALQGGKMELFTQLNFIALQTDYP